MTNTKRKYVILAMLAVYIFWGGTYLGMKVAVETMPPFLMAGSRFIFSGLILYIWSRLSGESRPSKQQWISAGIVGALLLLGGNGLVAWAEQTVPSGIAALLIATVPLWIIALSWIGKNGKNPGIGVIAGVLLGFVGIGVLVLNTGGSSSAEALNPIGVGALLVAAFSWSLGSLYSRKAKVPSSPLMSTAIQMIVGGTLQFLVSPLLGEWQRFDISRVSFRSCVAMLYLIIFGSIVAYNSYVWLLKHVEPSIVSTYAFVNPVLAVFFGWIIIGEKLTANSIIAAVVIITSVIIITVSQNRSTVAQIPKQESLDSSNT